MAMKTGNDQIICVKDLTAAYDGIVIIDSLSFTVNRGEIFFILGGSGCGKSTLMKLMIGLNKPVSGKVLIDDHDIVTAEGDKRLHILRKIGVLYQSGALFGSMTLFENVRLPLEEFTNLPPSAMDLIVLMKLKLVGLHGYENLMPAELSGGMQKRAAIARAMALDPQILFLDEPSSGLDPITSAELDRLILRLAQNLRITFIIITHELHSLFAVADRMIMLDKEAKGIVAEGNPRELRDKSNNQFVRKFFNREVSPEVSFKSE